MRVGVQTEITEALELVSEFRLCVLDTRLAFGGDDFQAVRVDVCHETAADGRRGRFGNGRTDGWDSRPYRGFAR